MNYISFLSNDLIPPGRKRLTYPAREMIPLLLKPIIMKSRGIVRGQVQLKDGFYIEIFDMDVKKGMKIRSETKKAMEEIAGRYSGYKRVVILGEYKDGLPFTGLATN